MMIVVIEGKDAMTEEDTGYSYGDAELTFEATHADMTHGFLAWMIQGWLDLIGVYGWWEERLELRDETHGILAVGTLRGPR